MDIPIGRGEVLTNEDTITVTVTETRTRSMKLTVSAARDYLLAAESISEATWPLHPATMVHEIVRLRPGMFRDLIEQQPSVVEETDCEWTAEWHDAPTNPGGIGALRKRVSG